MRWDHVLSCYLYVKENGFYSYNKGPYAFDIKSNQSVITIILYTVTKFCEKVMTKMCLLKKDGRKQRKIKK